MKIEITNGVETPVTKFFSATPETEIHSCHDQCQKPMCVLRRERDEARELHRNALREREATEKEVDATLERAQKAERERDEARKHCESIIEKANELIARWDQPSWKDTAPTAGFIHALRDAVEDYEKREP